MKDPERLLDASFDDPRLDDDIRSLLRSASADVPPDADVQQRRIRGNGAGVLGSSMVRKVSWWSARNVAWVGLAVTLFTIGSLGLRSAPSPVAREIAVAPVLVATSQATAEAVTEKAPQAAAPEAMPSLRVDDLPAAHTPSAKPTVAARPTAPVVSPAPATDADEIAIIDAARGALAKAPATALSHVARYRSLFRSPRFSDEADAVEVQALAALGRRDEASSKAAAFLAAHPNSPYSQRVRSAVSAR